MSSPIKPTGPGGLPPALPEAKPGASRPSGDFRRELSETAQPSAAAPASQAPLAGGVRDVVAELHAGRIDRVQAVDRIVAQEVERVARAGLTPTARAELERLLRGTLEHDPNLSALLDDASR